MTLVSIGCDYLCFIFSSQKDGSNVSSFEPAVMVEDHMVKSSHEPKRNVSETTLDDTSSFNDHIENDWEREQIIRTMKSLTDESFNAEGKNEAWINRCHFFFFTYFESYYNMFNHKFCIYYLNSDLPNEYKSILMKFCDIQYSSDNAFLKDIPHANQPISVQQFLNVVTAALPKVSYSSVHICRTQFWIADYLPLSSYTYTTHHKCYFFFRSFPIFC